MWKTCCDGRRFVFALKKYFFEIQMMVAVDIKAEKLVQQIAKKYSLKLLLLFGSRATGKNYATSDFDVAYLSNKDLDLMEEARLMLDLSPVFKSEDIDLVNFRTYAFDMIFY